MAHVFITINQQWVRYSCYIMKSYRKSRRKFLPIFFLSRKVQWHKGIQVTTEFLCFLSFPLDCDSTLAKDVYIWLCGWRALKKLETFPPRSCQNTLKRGNWNISVLKIQIVNLKFENFLYTIKSSKNLLTWVASSALVKTIQ